MSLSISELEALAARVDHTVLDPIVQEFKTQNDRAAVIVGAAQLDDLLGELLFKFFLPHWKRVKDRESDPLLSFNGPFGTFSSRIQGTHRMGLIGDKFASSLDDIRRIRNACAHKVTSPNLNESPHCERIAGLHRPIPSATFWSNTIAEFGEDCPANQFRAVVAMMCHQLLFDTQNVKPAKRQLLLSANF